MILQPNHFVRSCGFAVALAGIVACAEEKEPKTPASTTEPLAAPMPAPQPAAPQAAAQPATFTLAPPVGTRFIRTEKRNYETSLDGTPLARRQENELRWQVEIGRSGEQYLITQKLQHVSLKRNGATVLDADVAPGAISAQLVIDRAGNIADVRGLENTSQTFRSLAAGGAKMDDLEERAMSPAALKTLVAMRYDMLSGDLAGRAVKTGSSWTIPGRLNSAIASKTVTVEKMEGCGKTQCARIRTDVKLDPASALEIADDLIKRRVKEMGGDPSKIKTESATHTVTGSFLTDPATLLNYDGSVSEKAHVMASADKEKFAVTMTGTTQYTIDYGKQPVAAATKP